MANQFKYQDIASREGGLVVCNGIVTTSTSGTIGSQACKGFTVTKTGGKTGRYTIVTDQPYQKFLNVIVSQSIATDAAYTSAKGEYCGFIRNVTTSGCDIQFVNRATQPVDTEIEDGNLIYITVFMKNTTGF